MQHESRRPEWAQGGAYGAELLRSPSPLRPEDLEDVERLTHRRLLPMAWSRYGLASDAALEVVQNTLVEFLRVRHRYEVVATHGIVLMRIFRSECLEHIDRSARERRHLGDDCENRNAPREETFVESPAATQSGGGADSPFRSEETEHIRAAIERLRPASRTFVAWTIDRGASRQEMIDRFRRNENAPRARPHTRRELRRLLARLSVTTSDS